MNEPKTKVLKTGRERRHVDVQEYADLLLDVVDQFEYLGSHLTWNNDISIDVQIRIGKGSKCSWAYKAIPQSRSVSHRT